MMLWRLLELLKSYFLNLYGLYARTESSGLAHQLLSVVTDMAKMSSGNQSAPLMRRRVTLPATDAALYAVTEQQTSAERQSLPRQGGEALESPRV